jgi:nucleotide-binding universal stress UspA family protein
MKLLICTDGSSSSMQTADLISNIRFIPDTRISILGVAERKNDLDKITASMDYIETLLNSRYIVERKIRNGDPIEEIMSEVVEKEYDLVVVGGGGKQLGFLNPQLGSTTSKLARKLHPHILVARNVPKIINKVLFCTGSDAPASKTMALGGEWISYTDAQIGVIHVLPYKRVKEQELVLQLGMNTINGNEIQDSILMQACQELRNAGIKNEITPKLKHGLVVEEIISELLDGRYDLLVVGAHYQPGQDRWQGTLLDDVTDQLLNRSSCSVLIV